MSSNAFRGHHHPFKKNGDTTDDPEMAFCYTHCPKCHQEIEMEWVESGRPSNKEGSSLEGFCGACQLSFVWLITQMTLMISTEE
jgi:hypothetical protein